MSRHPPETTFIFGHRAEIRANEAGDRRWHFTDTGEEHVSAEGTMIGTECVNPRRCPKCKQYPTAAGHDPCIANLPGVAYACCGHGVRPGYIAFTDGRVIRGKFTELP